MFHLILFHSKYTFSQVLLLLKLLFGPIYFREFNLWSEFLFKTLKNHHQQNVKKDSVDNMSKTSMYSSADICVVTSCGPPCLMKAPSSQEVKI